MRKTGRYDTSGSTEDQFEPGSKGRVLKNLLGIKSKREMDRLEAIEYAKVFEQAVRLYGLSHKFTANDICRLHRLWLGAIYPWAGSYRSVNISKGNFSFAAARHVPKLMADLEKNVLVKAVPCKARSLEEIAGTLAIVHTELVLIHPFREGNGRLARLVSVLMALQAGLPVLDFGKIRGSKKEEYFEAVRSGLDKDYRPMSRFFLEVIGQGLKRVSRKTLRNGFSSGGRPSRQ